MDKFKKTAAARLIEKHTNNLIKKLLLLFLGAAATGILFFSVLHTGISWGLDSFFYKSDYLEHAEQRTVENLQEYIQEGALTPFDSDLLSKWVKKKNIVYLEIYRDNRPLYISGSPMDMVLDEQEIPYYKNHRYTLKFADGEADIVLLGIFDYQFYSSALIAEILLAFVVFLVLFILGIKKRIQYIQELQTAISGMEGGCLEYPITVKGEDELAKLAEGLEQLRLSLKQNIQIENDLKQANQNLITGIAHDLRTPLTALTMYIQILQSDVCTDGSAKQYYLEKIMGKASMMKELSDRLFECSQIHDDEDEKPLNETRTLQDTFMDYLSEMAMYLENRGFNVEAELEWRAVSIGVRMDYIARIIDNMSSNLVKYAAPFAPITLKTIYENHMAGIEIVNQITTQNGQVESTKVGIKNVKRMMNQMNGICQIEMEQKFYKIRLLSTIID